MEKRAQSASKTDCKTMSRRAILVLTSGHLLFIRGEFSAYTHTQAHTRTHLRAHTHTSAHFEGVPAGCCCLMKENYPRKAEGM